ncbi:phospholipase D-like domain-containing protein [Arcticibacter eurypsychrophilus]|uniref:phospholipase D-like domain-containing protein n=1 Tax=Arcticibacter eurypsychrophilus TaxID=1434752 RepID=UPI00084DF4E4|nr:phospholipase D-like domain-containing protein [Arcticibacter eurypsychrophilus]
MILIKNLLGLILLLTLVSCSKSKQDSLEGLPLDISFPSAYFTDPDKIASQSASPVIMDKLIAMINASPAHSSIYLSIFGFDHSGVIASLKKASKRGVDLHLLVDNSIDETRLQNAKTISTIKGFLTDGSELVIVDNDCTASAINHNKFVLFSSLNTLEGLKHQVIFQTSHNFTIDDSKKIQDAVVVSDSGIYEAYFNYWQDISKKAVSGMTNFYYREYQNELTGISAYYFPKRRNGVSYGDDTIIEILNGISKPSGAIIKVGMSDWTSSRLNIVNKLGDLLNAGAHIEVIAKNKADIEILNGLEGLRKKGAYIKIYNIVNSNQQKVNIHAKFLMIKGEWKGKQCTVLATGSHNYTQNALRNNNETLLLFKNNTVLYNAYTIWYDALKKLPGSSE